MLFVEILFAVRTITFRSISLYMMHNGHSLPHIFSLQQTTPFFGIKIVQTIIFVGVAKNYLSESDAASEAPSILIRSMRAIHEFKDHFHP